MEVYCLKYINICTGKTSIKLPHLSGCPCGLTIKTYLAEEALTKSSSGHHIASRYCCKSVRPSKRFTPSVCFSNESFWDLKGRSLLVDVLKEM